VSVEEAFARLCEGTAHAAEVRSVLLLEVLRRPGVLDFVSSYVGDADPVHVAEAAGVAGFGHFDDIDLALLALAVGPGPESVASETAPRAARFIEGRGAPLDVPAELAERWREMTDVERLDTAVDLMEEPEVRAFRARYRGPVEPGRILEAARSDGIQICTDEGLVTLAVLCGWRPE